MYKLLKLLTLFRIFCLNFGAWPGYQILNERCEITYNNRKYINIWVKTGRSNRTTITINGTINVYQTISNEAVVKVIGYEFKSNEYRRSSIEISRYLCDYFNHEFKMLFQKTLEKQGHIMQSCPFEKGFYYFTNFVMESTYIPFKPIGEKWMFEGNLTLGDLLLTRILWYIKIERSSDFYTH